MYTRHIIPGMQHGVVSGRGPGEPGAVLVPQRLVESTTQYSAVTTTVATTALRCWCVDTRV